MPTFVNEEEYQWEFCGRTLDTRGSSNQSAYSVNYKVVVQRGGGVHMC